MFNALEKVNLKDFIIKNGGLDYELSAGAGNTFWWSKTTSACRKSYSKKIAIFYILDEAVF